MSASVSAFTVTASQILSYVRLWRDEPGEANAMAPAAEELLNDTVERAVEVRFERRMFLPRWHLCRDAIHVKMD